MKYDFTLTPAQQALVERNLELVKRTILRYIKTNEGVYGLGYDDLYQEGSVALCRAAATYDGVSAQFTTYASSLIHNHLLDCCKAASTRQKHLCGLPVGSGFADDEHPPSLPEPSVEDGTDHLGKPVEKGRADSQKEYRLKTLGGRSYEYILYRCGNLSPQNRRRRKHPSRRHRQPQKYLLDMQEMALWTCLNWRIVDERQAEAHYTELELNQISSPIRTFEACLKRLVVRGLAVSGTGDTDMDALYDLLGRLYVVPISESIFLRALTFLKMTVLDGVPLATAKQLFQRDHPNEREAQVMALSKQALLSTAELVKCAEVGAKDLSSHQKVMDALYNDDTTTCNNIVWEMRGTNSQASVTLAVANLYLRKQIIFERL